MWQNLKTKNKLKLKNPNVTELNHSKGYKTKKKNVTKLINSNCDKTQKLKLWQYSTAQIVTKLKNWGCDTKKSDSDYDKILKKKFFLSERLDTSTTDEMYSEQHFAI